MRAAHFQSSRGWIARTGPKNRRATTLKFVLPRAGRVVFVVEQVSPECVEIGHFSIRGHAGLNRVRFAGRVKGQELAPGTYRISILAPSGRVIRRVTLVVVNGASLSREELRSLRAANTCAASAEQAPIFSSEMGSTGGGQSSGGSSLSNPQGQGLGVTAPTAPDVNSGVLGSSIQETARAIRPILVALLALAIVLFSVASLPRVALPGPRAHDVLARHRVEIAGLGVAALVAVAIAFFIG